MEGVSILLEGSVVLAVGVVWLLLMELGQEVIENVAGAWENLGGRRSWGGEVRWVRNSASTGIRSRRLDDVMMGSIANIGGTQNLSVRYPPGSSKQSGRMSILEEEVLKRNLYDQ